LQPREKQFNYEKFGAGYYVVAWATAFFRFMLLSWPVIWTIGEWMNVSLQSAILPSMVGLNGVLTLGAAEGLSINDDVLDYVIGAWYIMGPMILSTVITLAGYQSGQAIQSAAEGNSSGKGTGQKGGS
ncbi:MAG: hypothetical protein KZQ56_08765, partial [gamma proteobacterium symbiont of Lucinoma myriamae]|nr:hypothetical protein [gamma proteobacterium symbiont of Lucinoma myriamae]